jgi:uncharacterized DUF497 family protein
VDINFLHQGQRFIWDSEKASSNLSKHDVRFETACEVFFDRFVRIEDAGLDNENRDAAIGMTEDLVLLLVVHIYREDETIRIISARRATGKERIAYENSE